MGRGLTNLFIQMLENERLMVIKKAVPTPCRPGTAELRIEYLFRHV